MEESRRGALCNKAIMIVTDGAVQNYEEVFAKYNSPRKNVRFVLSDVNIRNHILLIKHYYQQMIAFCSYVAWISLFKWLKTMLLYWK